MEILHRLYSGQNSSSQWKRFEVLTGISENINSLIDLGCGMGHLYNFLLERDFRGSYLGLDFVSEFIEIACEKYHKSSVRFEVFDIRKDILPNGFDYIILNGVFNNKMSDNKEFMLDTINKLFKASGKGVAFNAMSTYVDYYDENLYYSNPLEVFDFCKKKLPGKVVLRHDYLVKKSSIPFEYTIYLYK